MATNVFISWSGDLSKRLAEATRDWLPGVLQFVRPYFTPDDIEKGARWGADINSELESSDIGIICLTKENTQKPWILFEAGALSKSLEKSRVCTVLFDLDTTDLKGPLTLFQHTKFERDEFKKLVKTVNNAGGDAKLDENVLNTVFQMWWPKLDEQVQGILQDHRNAPPAAERSERDMLEEILELTRLGARDRREPREIEPEIFMELIDGLERFIHYSLRRGMFSVTAWHMLERTLLRLADRSGVPMVDKEVHFRMRRLFDELHERREAEAESEKTEDS